MADTVRQRAGATPKQDLSNTAHPPENYKKKASSHRLFRCTLWLVIFTINALLMLFIHVRFHSYPVPKTLKTAEGGQFVEERAREYLTNLTSFGSRFVGSPANEVKTVEYLLKEIKKIKMAARSMHTMEIHLQKTSGTFSIKFLGEFTSYYENVNNVLVKLSTKGGVDDALLVNCHYDSVLDSPGASDDAISCALMLEVLNVLTQRPYALPHPVIFIFNGAEENILQASHGFITKHKWAKDVRAFVNLDAAGAGGSELLFQAGPGHPWLVRTYGESVEHPSASVLGQEVFESGLIPSDTDYRIYRDFGQVPGLDIAYINNGYVYHTKFDNMDMVPPGSMQRGGDNLLALVQGLANSPLLTDPGEDRHGSVVFYDLMGLYMIVYPARMGFIMNGIMAFIILANIFRKIISKNKRRGMLVGLPYVKLLVFAMFVVGMSWVLTLSVVMGIGYGLDLVGRALSWYSNVLVLVGLYAAPAMLVLLLIHSWAKSKIFSDVDPWASEMVFYDAHQFILCALLIFMTYKGINSACVLLLWLAVPTIIRDFIGKIVAGINFKDNQSTFLILHLTGQIIPNMVTTQFVYGVLLMFVPVMGRIGSQAIPDVFIGGVVGFAVLAAHMYQVGLVYVCRGLRALLWLLVGVFVVTLIIVLFTPIGFPYRANPMQPTRNRQIITHIDRVFLNKSGDVDKRDSLIWIIPFDRNGIKHLRKAVPSLEKTELVKCEVEKPYCGVPYYYPMLMMMRDTYYIPAGPTSATPDCEMEILKKDQRGPHSVRYTFIVTGPSHINVFIVPKPGINMTRWSLGNGDPHPTLTPEGMPDTYFIYYSYGKKPSSPWEFWIDLEVANETLAKKNDGKVDIALAAHYFKDKGRWSKDLREFQGSLPDWVIDTSWTATYTSYVF